MIFIETNDYKEQLALEEEFSREDNLFAVPIGRSSRIKTILQSIKSEIFGMDSALAWMESKGNAVLSQMCRKMDSWLQNGFRLQFSLSTVREIYHLIKLEANRITQYHTFYAQVGKYMEDSEELEQNTDSNQLGTQKSIARDQINDLSACYSHLITKKEAGPIYPQDINTMDSQLMRTLKSQLPNSPKFITSRLVDIQNSEHILDNCCEEENLVRVQNSTDSKASPSSKSKKQLKKLKSLLSTQESEQKTDIYASLSGRFHPLPSFLHDEHSFGEMIAKQKKQDIRKSKIINSEIKNQDFFNQDESNLQNYNSSIRAIKLNNKLRKNSRKSLSNKLQAESELTTKTTLPYRDLEKPQKQLVENPKKISHQLNKTCSKKGFKFFKSKF